jgi:MoaD family protein
MVRIKLFANLREAAGGKRVVECDLPGPVSTTELMQRLSDDYGEKTRDLLFSQDGTVRENILVMRNGQMVRDRDDKAISPGDEVAVLLPVAGG